MPKDGEKVKSTARGVDDGRVEGGRLGKLSSSDGVHVSSVSWSWLEIGLTPKQVTDGRKGRSRPSFITRRSHSAVRKRRKSTPKRVRKGKLAED